MGLLINGEYIDDDVVRQEANSMRPQYEEATQGMDPVEARLQLWEWSRENVIERVLIRQEAAREATPLDEDEVAAEVTRLMPPPGEDECQPGEVRAGYDPAEVRKEVVARLQTEQFLQKFSAKVPPPKKKEIQEYYWKNREQFRGAEMARASHIVKNVTPEVDEAAARAAIEQVQAELGTGAAFAEVADRHSDCAGQGGLLGWFPRGEMVDEFDDAIFALEPGQTTGIFRTVFGYHIATLHEKRPSGIRPLEEVSSMIEEHLSAERRQKALEDYVDKLKETADIQKVKQRTPASAGATP